MDAKRSQNIRIVIADDHPIFRDGLRRLLEAEPGLKVIGEASDGSDAVKLARQLKPDIMLLDQMTPPREPQIPSLWIEPPKQGSPLPVRAVVNGAVIKSWRSDDALGAGLHAKEADIRVAEVFQLFEGDMPVGSLAEGPTVIARPSTDRRPKLAVMGFDPLSGQLRFEVTTPLLFANLLRWLSPEPFKTVDATASRVGPASVILDASERAARIRAG